MEVSARLVVQFKSLVKLLGFHRSLRLGDEVPPRHRAQ